VRARLSAVQVLGVQSMSWMFAGTFGALPQSVTKHKYEQKQKKAEICFMERMSVCCTSNEEQLEAVNDKWTNLPTGLSAAMC